VSLQLAELADPLSALGHDVTFVVGQGHQPDQLLVALGADEQRGLHAQLMFLPGMDDPQVLQMYVGLPVPVEPSGYDRLCRFLIAVNGPLPIGAFGLLEAERIVYYRLNEPISDSDLDPTLLSWELSLIGLIVSRVGALVEDVALGMELEEGRSRLHGMLEQLVEER
jgi:hypothetical protein